MSPRSAKSKTNRKAAESGLVKRRKSKNARVIESVAVAIMKPKATEEKEEGTRARVPSSPSSPSSSVNLIFIVSPGAAFQHDNVCMKVDDKIRKGEAFERVQICSDVECRDYDFDFVVPGGIYLADVKCQEPSDVFEILEQDLALRDKSRALRPKISITPIVWMLDPAAPSPLTDAEAAKNWTTYEVGGRLARLPQFTAETWIQRKPDESVEKFVMRQI